MINSQFEEGKRLHVQYNICDNENKLQTDRKLIPKKNSLESYNKKEI